MGFTAVSLCISDASYVAPRVTTDDLQTHWEGISNIIDSHISDEFFIIDDLSLSDISWEPIDYVFEPVGTTSPRSIEFVNNFH